MAGNETNSPRLNTGSSKELLTATRLPYLVIHRNVTVLIWNSCICSQSL